MRLTRSIYKVCGALAATTLCLIAVLILAQIALRLMGKQIPSADDFAAWALSASIFLALPAALLHGDHIRITSVRGRIPEPYGRWVDIFAAVIACAMLTWGSVALFAFVRDSYLYHDVSTGLVIVPMWIPQLAMVLGSTLFAVAMAERVIRLCLGLPTEIDTTPSPESEI
jgi:TRAP-type C4-dicarboxylate transport system permease small subunit